jgi:AcrR family transcriptional regulator
MITTKDTILEAAMELFSEFGYSGCSTKKIASKAGINEVTLFRLFGSKKNLLSEVIQRYSANEVISPDFKDRLTWDLKEDLSALGMSYLKMVDGHIHTILMAITESHRIREIRKIVSSSPNEHGKALSWYLDEQIKRGNCRKLADTGLAARCFFAPFFEYCVFKSISPGYGVKPALMVAEFVDLFLRGIAGG